MSYQERLVAMVAELAEEEQALSVRQSSQDQPFSLAQQAELQRLHAMRECLEAALLCDRENDTVARQKARAAVASVDAWHDLEKQGRGRKR